MVDVEFEPTTQKTHVPADDAISKVIGWGHRMPLAGLPIDQVLGEYSLPLPS